MKTAIQLVAQNLLDIKTPKKVIKKDKVITIISEYFTPMILISDKTPPRKDDNANTL